MEHRTVTAVQPPAVPAAPQADLTDASQAAADRLNAAFPDSGTAGPAATPPQPGGAAPPPAEAPFDIFADNAIEGLNLGELQYRDGKRLENELRAARDRFKPFNDAFGALDDAQRQQLLAAAPTLGADLAMFSNVLAQIHPDDRSYFAEAMDLMATDPIAAADMLARGAEVLRQAFGQPAAQPGPSTVPTTGGIPTHWIDAPPADPMQAPLTRADFEAMMRERDEASAVAAARDTIYQEARDLGYDPESNDPVAYTRFTTLINLAGRPEVNGDLAKAHQLIEQERQASIDEFVQGKAADAGRPAAPVAGAAPAETRALTTTLDAEAAMRARLEASLGPDPRRRAAED